MHFTQASFCENIMIGNWMFLKTLHTGWEASKHNGHDGKRWSYYFKQQRWD